MQNMLKQVRAKFSPYVNDFEKQVDVFLNKVKPDSDPQQVRADATALMQTDVAAVVLWCERQLKGYTSLSKEARTQMYTNLVSIKSSFQSYSFMRVPDEDVLSLELFEKGVNTDNLKSVHRQIQYLKQIMDFFGGQVIYESKKGFSFAMLLRDAQKNLLVGDHHQIMILYVYLYALKYEVADLQLKITPTKTCLHFEGVDIDMEQGTFEKYTKEICELAPITEILALNLLDIPEQISEAFAIAPASLSKVAELANLLSDRVEIVTQNRKIAFRKIVLHHVTAEQFDKAMSFAMESKDIEAVQHVAIKATAFYLKKDDFIEAHRYAVHTKDSETIIKKVHEKEGIAFYNKKNYIRAGEKFKKAGNAAFLKKCYAGLFFQEQTKIKHVKLLSELKQNKKTILQMKLYAEKSEDQKLVAYSQGLLDQVNGKKKS